MRQLPLLRAADIPEDLADPHGEISNDLQACAPEARLSPSRFRGIGDDLQAHPTIRAPAIPLLRINRQIQAAPVRAPPLARPSVADIAAAAKELTGKYRQPSSLPQSHAGNLQRSASAAHYPRAGSRICGNNRKIQARIATFLKSCFSGSAVDRRPWTLAARRPYLRD
jgi:hypothetical protein